MDEQTLFRSLKDKPENEAVRRAYFDCLVESGDYRAEYVRLMNERRALEKNLAEIDSQLSTFWPQVSDEWLSIVFPLYIYSPTPGRFYTSPSANSPPFVSVGDYVKADTVVCIIEAMKIMNEITAGVEGVVAEVKVSNGDPVEYNQELVRLHRPPRPVRGG